MKRKCVLNKKHGMFQLSITAVEHMIESKPRALFGVFDEVETKPAPETLDPSRYKPVADHPLPIGINKRHAHEIVWPRMGKIYKFPIRKAKYRFYPPLVRAVENLGQEASGDHSKLRVEEITIEFSIDGHDGLERQMRVHAHNSL